MKKVLLSLMILVNLGYANTNDESNPEKEKIIEKINVDYSFEKAKQLTKMRTNPELGFRMAGSTSEHEAADLLVDEFNKLGLTNVRKDAFKLDTWEFKKAELTYNNNENKSEKITIASYMTTFVTNGEESFELVYLGKGTKEDYKDIDVKDKIILIDINQRDDWWINYPAFQANIKGAKAVIAISGTGYAEINDQALNLQDICGPDTAPALSISKADGEKLKKLLGTSNKMTIGLTIDSQVKRNGTAYNVVGEIKGKNPESYIILNSHYDAYFEGFQDNASAVAMSMGIAKSIIDSGYQPNKTIIVIAHAAEEWGTIDTRYDWSVGSHKQITKVTPDWAKKTFALINFEQPASEHVKVQEIRAIYEYKIFMESIANKIKPRITGIYPEGIKITTPPRSWADDFAYSIAGVPTIRNDYVGADFLRTTYHTNFDTEKTYNKKAFIANHELYAQLVYELDQLDILPMDFSTRFDELYTTLELDMLKNINGDKTAKDLLSKIDKVKMTSNKLKQVIDKIETDNKIKDSTKKEVNKKLLGVYKEAQDSFIKLTWEDESIFPHEHAQNNLTALTSGISYLKANDIEKALDEISAVDNNWYALYFDKEVYTYFTEQVTKQSADRLNWGKGRVMGHVDLYDIIESLQTKQKNGTTDFTSEISKLENFKKSQKKLYTKTITKEMKNIDKIEKKLDSLIKYIEKNK